jgi:hypothetical protein
MESSLVKKPTGVIVGAARNRRRAAGLHDMDEPVFMPDA